MLVCIFSHWYYYSHDVAGEVLLKLLLTVQYPDKYDVM